jgi:hypothetical protein
LTCLLAAAVGWSGAATAEAAETRYSLAGGCFELRSLAAGALVGKTADGDYRAGGGTAAERFRMKATELGRYLFYGRAGDFMARGGGAVELPVGGSGDSVASAREASESANWRVDAAGPGLFRIVLPAADGKVLAVGDGGQLVLADPGSAGTAAEFAFSPADGCASFPEIETSVTGTPSRGRTPWGEVRGLLDAHMHMMAFEFLGGSAHCGRPWHPFGVAHALVDCPDHQPNGAGAVLENVLYKQPARTHDPVGWPTFRDWPHHKSLTHEGSYYKWLERAWMGGLRVFVNLLVDNGVLCELYPLKRNSCNEMDGVRLQARRIRELQDYIDAQSGGPGKGWFRIVTDPFQARRVISRGKLAVVLGIEVSKLFDCGVYNDAPKCNREQIDRQLDEVYRLGVRDMELVNKFDNALAGVAGDSGDTGLVVNSGNRYDTGRFWQLQHCDGANHVHDREQHAPPRDPLVGNALRAFLPPGTAPVYPEPPHCNTRGLSDLGEHLVRRMMDKGMIIDPDHLSVAARKQLLSLVEARRYSGIVSSHSWSTPDATPRIYDLGGVVTPYAGSSADFVHAWQETRPHRNRRFYFGFGYGADMNGFGAQGGPRNGPNPVAYPFKSFDGSVLVHKQRSGERLYDINSDGVAHYGLYPDWVEDLRRQAGDQIVRDMGRGSEAYLQMWERAVGVRHGCLAAHARFGRRGLGRLRLRAAARAALRRAGQPLRRGHRAWRYCVRGRNSRRARVAAVLNRRGKLTLLASNARGHRARRIGRGARAGRLRGRARSIGGGLFVRRAGPSTRFVYRVRAGRVRYVAIASRSLASSPRRLRAQLRLAGLR